MSFKLEICRSVVLLVAIVIVVMGAAAEATDTVMGAAAMTTDTVMGGASKAIDTKLVSAACNKQKISSCSPFYKNLGAVLEDLKQNTAFSGYDYKTSRAGNEGAPTAYGRGICSQSVSQSGCKACLSNVAKRIYHICNNAIGARVQLTDCFLKYEQHNF